MHVRRSLLTLRLGPQQCGAGHVSPQEVGTLPRRIPSWHRVIMTAGAVSALTLSTVMGTAASASPADSTSDPSTDTAVRTSVDNSRAIVQLSLAPLTTSPRTKPAPGKKLDFSSDVKVSVM